MADPIIQTIQISLPGAGRTSSHTLETGTTVKFTFDLSGAVFTGVEGNLEIAVEGGGTVILNNYQALAEAEGLPLFETVNGEQVAGDVYLFAFTEAGQTAEDLETAADGAAGGSGAGEYSDAPGALFDGIDALAPQSDAFARGAATSEAVLNEATPDAGGLGPVAPTANNPPEVTGDTAAAVEFGAEHFLTLGGAALASQAEINAVSTVTGNVLANDEDVDNADMVNQPGETPEVFVADAFTKNNDGSIRDILDVYNDTDISDGTTAGQVMLQGLYGTLTINADGSYTYVVDNANPEVNVLNTGQTLTDTFHYTARNADGDGVESAEASLDITINGTNDAPTDADFIVTGDLGAGGGIIIPFARFDQNITDPEDDHAGTDSSFRIETLPEGGTLYHDGVAVQVGETYDLDDPIGQFTYEAAPDIVNGLLLGSRESSDAGLSAWGDKVGNSTREMTVDLDGDGTDDVTITTGISSGPLKAYDHQANHIGHGLANKSHNGIDMGETLTVNFNGTLVAYAEIGFDGLGNYFNPDSQQDAFATWVAYNGSQVVAWGTVNNDEMSYSLDPAVPTTHEGWLNATLVSADHDGVSGNQGDLFQSFVLNQDILDGETFDRLEFGTTEDGARDWNANWELRYVDVEFAGAHSFTYTAMDADGRTDTGIHDGPATVTILPGNAINETPVAEPDLLVTNEDAAPSSGSVALNDTDFDDTASELTFVLDDPAPAGLTFNADGTYEFDPSSYQHLPQGDQVEFELDYTVYDNGVPVEGASSTLTITVLGVNDAPTLDLSSGDVDVTFVGQNAGYINMLGVYHLVNGVPAEPEIIVENSKTVPNGELLATYAGDDNFGFFLIPNGGNMNLSGHDMEFVRNPDGSWALSTDGTTVDVRFDHAGFNPSGEEATFLVRPQADGSWLVLTDDQLSDRDDDDFNDLVVQVDPGVSGLGYADVYTENDPPVSLTGNVDIDDIDNGAAISKATITYMPVDENDVITVPAGWTAATVTDPGTGMVTMTFTPEADIGTYESLFNGMTFANTSDNPVGGDRVFTFVVTDDQGADSNPASSTITVVPVNDPPVAGADSGHLFATPGQGETAGSSAWSLLAQEFIPDGNGEGTWTDAQLAQWGQNYGVLSGTDNTHTGFDKEIENQGTRERLAVNFESPQSVVELNVTSHGGGEEMIAILDAQGNYIANDTDPGTADPLDIAFNGNRIIVSYPGGSIGTVYLMAPDTARGNNRPDVALKDVHSAPAPVFDAGEATVATGNVLDNDYDIDSPALEVLEARAEGSAWTAVDAEAGHAHGTAVAGQYGTLYLFENGEYSYELDPGVLTSGTIPESETFEYRVADSAEGAAHGTGNDTATLTVNIFDTSDNGFVQGDGDGDLLLGNSRDNAVFGMDGNDLIGDGLLGDDLLDGGSGNDTLIGVSGNNTLYGSQGDDILVGGIGGDVLWGGSGDDTVYGSFGQDTIYVSEGDDVIHVQSGNDTVVIDPAFIGMGGSNATIINFHSGGDVLELGDVTGKAMEADEVGSDLRITLSNPGGTPEADIVITLEDVSASDFTGGIELSDNAELNHLIQSIVDSGSVTTI